MFQPPPTIKPKIESGADKRTKSQVIFGEPRLADEFYETTTHSVFKPVSVPYTYARNNLNKSVVPLDYYGKYVYPNTHNIDLGHTGYII